MEPIELLKGTLRRWRIAAVMAIVGGIVGVLTAPPAISHSSRKWSATHTLILSTTAAPAKGTGNNQASANLATAALLITKGEVPKRVAALLHYTGDPDSLGRSVTTKEDDQTGTLSVRAADRDRVRATDLANTFGHEVTAYLTEQAAAAQQRSLDDAKKALQASQAELQRLDAALAAAKAPDVDLLTSQHDAAARQLSTNNDRVQQLLATPPPAPSLVTLDEASPANLALVSSGYTVTNRRSVRGVAGFLAGAVLGLAIALGMELMNPRVCDRGGAQRGFLLPALAEVPLLPRKYRNLEEVTTWHRPKSPVATAYRHLRSALVMGSVNELADVPRLPEVMTNGNGAERNGHAYPVVAERHPHVLLVLSPGTGEGRTTTVANLAATFAESGASVLVLGTDPYHSNVHRLFGVPDVPGLHDVLLRDPGSPGNLGSVMRRTNVPGVRIVTSGASVSDPSTLLTAKRHLVREAKQMVDVVILDSPPLLAAHDAAELMMEADTVVVTARVGRSRTRQARRTAETLARVGVQPVGLNLIGTGGFVTRFKRQEKLYRARRTVDTRKADKPATRTSPGGQRASAASSSDRPPTSAGPDGVL